MLDFGKPNSREPDFPKSGILMVCPSSDFHIVVPRTNRQTDYHPFKKQTPKIKFREIELSVVCLNIEFSKLEFICDLTFCDLDFYFSPEYFLYKSGLNFFVRSTACSCFQSSTSWSLPLSKISGTFIPLYSAGRV